MLGGNIDGQSGKTYPTSDRKTSTDLNAWASTVTIAEQTEIRSSVRSTELALVLVRLCSTGRQLRQQVRTRTRRGLS
jgi:hypothetical protein